MKTLCIVLFAALVQLNHALPSHPINQPSLPIEPFIKNGENAKIGEFPHQLLLVKIRNNSWKFRCGAVLINSHQALTAARCVEGDTADELAVVAGVHDKLYSKDAKILRIKKAVIHPRYNDGSASFSNDIAMLTFTKPVVFTSEIQPIIWNYNESLTFANDRCTLSGWGRFRSGMPNILQKVKMNIISNKQCVEKLKPVPYPVIYPGHICAYEPMYSGCDGDNGGPMTCQYEGRALLAGIASWAISGFSGCDANFPSVYTRVSHFENFIRDNLIDGLKTD